MRDNSSSTVVLYSNWQHVCLWSNTVLELCPKCSHRAELKTMIAISILVVMSC